MVAEEPILTWTNLCCWSIIPRFPQKSQVRGWGPVGPINIFGHPMSVTHLPSFSPIGHTGRLSLALGMSARPLSEDQHLI